MTFTNTQTTELSLDQLDNVSAGFFRAALKGAKVAVLTKRALINSTITTGRAATKANKAAIKNIIREGVETIGFTGVNRGLDSVVSLGQVASHLAPTSRAAGGFIGMGIAGITSLFK